VHSETNEAADMSDSSASDIRVLAISHGVWALIVIVCLANFGLAERFPVKTFTAANGLLRDSVTKIRQDSHGFLWFCTADGVSKFDGYGFTNFTTDDGLPDRHVNDLYQTSDGTIFIATDGGLARLNPNGISGSAENPLFSVFRTSDDASVRFQSLVEGKNGELLCGTSAGLYSFDGRQFEKAKFEDVERGPDVNQVIRTFEGKIWIGTVSNGIFYSVDDDHLTYHRGPDLPESAVPALLQTGDGKLWVGLRPGKTGGLCRLNIDAGEPKLDKCFNLSDGLPANWITALLESRDGAMWVATTSSLCRWLGEGERTVCKDYTSTNDLCDFEVWSLLEDKDSNIWAGTRCGLKQLSSTGFTSFTEADGLGRGIVNSIFEDLDRELIASVSDGRIISRYAGERFSMVKPTLTPKVDYFGWGWKQTVLQDSTGSWWVPTGRGIYRSPPNTNFEKLRSTTLDKFGFPGKDAEIFRLFEDSHSNVWVATFGCGELWCWARKDGTWHDYTETAGIGSSRYATAFTETGNGELWITTGSDVDNTALLQFKNGSFRIFTKSENDLIRGWLRDIFVDEQGSVWVASTASGLLKVDPANAGDIKISHFARSNGLASSGVYCAAEDAFGRIYAGTGRGLDRLDPRTGVVENYSTFDGLPDSTVEGCYRDKDDVMWFGTSHGLARYVPLTSKPRQPPTLLITGLRVNDAAQSVSILGEKDIPQIDLDPTQRSVSIDFVGLGATLGEKLRYEYRLNDGNWSLANARTLNFADLQSGSYTIAIRAVTRDAIVSTDPATVSFAIAFPLWQRWWFIVGVSIGVAAFVYFVYRSRINKLLELERTRTRIATDLHDDIGSNLSQIALLSEVVRMKLTNGNEENNRMLTTIADVSRATVASMRDIVWAINPKRDSVLEMTRKMREHAEDILVPSGIAVHFVTAESDLSYTVSMDVRRELFLIFKEAINNAARHAECRNVTVDLTASGRTLNITIEDDGKGFDRSLPELSNGLLNMRTRAKKIGGTLSVVSSPGNGTKVSVVLNSAPRISVGYDRQNGA